MIPIALVTGFLGSGKTTLLQRIVDQSRARRFVYLVNEFSTVDVDGQLLDLPPDHLVSIPGGSIFCRCLVTQFVQHLRTIADSTPVPEGVVIEASGVADPRVVSQMLAETQLAEHFRLASVISLVDPDTFGDLLETLPTIRAQVEAAGLVIINKVDLHTEDVIAATETRVREINADVPLVRATYCDVEVPLFEQRPRRTVGGEYALCADPNYCRLRIRPAGEVDLAKLAAALDEVRQFAYRMKGFARVEGELVYLDVSRSGVVTRPAERPPATPELVCIYPPAAVHQMQTLAAQMEAGAFAVGR